MKTINLLVGMILIFLGIFTENNISVTLGCMNLILAKLEDL